MKFLKYISEIAVAALFMCSCDSWLDVKPMDQITEDGLYSNEKGFQRELNGVYLAMASNSLYGENLSCGALEVMGQHYFINADDNGYYNLSRYKYTEDNVKSRFESVWKNTYNLIANLNVFIEKLQEKKGILTASVYDLYLGEAYGLRAMLHLDMLRIFGPVCSAENEEVESIPYYDYYSQTPLPLLTVTEVAGKLEKDFDRAITLLKKDPVLTKGIVKGEGFWDYRNARLNYYAAYILKGRFYLHVGKKQEANKIATALLNGKDPETGEANNFLEIIKPVATSDLNNDRVYLSELVFYIQNLKRDDRIYKALFTSDLETKNILAASNEYISNLYTVSEQNDYRATQWTTSAAHANLRLFMKYAPVSLSAADKDPDRFKVHPLVRLGELFLMASESSEDETARLAWLETFRLNRGYQVGNTVGTNSDDLLDKEYTREFFGEGQYFFYLKRNQVETIQNQSGSKISMSQYYQMPLPDSEKNYRYE